MKLNTNINVTAKELKAAASYQDTIENIAKAVAEVFNTKMTKIPTPNNLEKIKYILGTSISKKDTINRDGIKIEYQYAISKSKGLTLHYSVEADENVIAEVFALYSDIINMFIPVITATSMQVKATLPLIKLRIDKADKKINELVK